MFFNPNNTNRVIFSAVLGLLALVTNLFTLNLFHEHHIPFGDLFIFLVASGFAPHLTACSAMIAELPLMLTGAHEAVLSVHMITFAVTISYLIKKCSSESPFFYFSVIWLTIAAALSIKSPGFLSHAQILFSAQLTLFGISRLMLLIPYVSSKIYGTLTRLPFNNLIPELLSILWVVTFGTILFQDIDNQLLVEILISRYGLTCTILFASITTVVPFIGRVLTSTLLIEYAPDIQAIIKSSYAPLEFKFSRSNWFKQKTVGQSHEPKTPSYRPTSEAVIAVSADNSLVLITALAAEILEIPSSSSLVGRRIVDISLSYPIFSKISQIVSDSRLKGKLSEEIRLDGKDELSNKYINFITEPEEQEQQSDDNKPRSCGVVIRLKDVSESRNLGHAVLDKKRRENVGFITAGVSHAFADALAATQTLAGMGLRSETLDGKDEAFRLILQVSESAELIVQQLIEFSESSPGTRSDINLCKTLSDRIEFLRQSIGRDACIDFTCSPKSMVINANSTLLIQAIAHLLINAKESFNGNPAIIDLSVGHEVIDETLAHAQPGARPGSYARIRVKDTGCGMNAEMMSRAFDPLYSTKSGHSGIGLSVVFGVVRAHDGFLTVESSIGKGTTVSIYLPEKNL
jgi:signal transduction histidine kinase